MSTLQLTRDTYARPLVAARRSQRAPSRSSAMHVAPVTPHTSSTPLPYGVTRVPHVGAWPTTTSCVCACHGDPLDACDVTSCVDIL